VSSSYIINISQFQKITQVIISIALQICQFFHTQTIHDGDHFIARFDSGFGDIRLHFEG